MIPIGAPRVPYPESSAAEMPPVVSVTAWEIASSVACGAIPVSRNDRDGVTQPSISAKCTTVQARSNISQIYGASVNGEDT